MRSWRRKPSRAITCREARFASVVIDTTRAYPSSPNAQATHAAPASVAIPRPHHAGSRPQPTSGSSGQTLWNAGPVRPTSSLVAAHSIASVPNPCSSQCRCQRSKAASLCSRV
jgi:hypothetical protein